MEPTLEIDPQGSICRSCPNSVSSRFKYKRCHVCNYKFCKMCCMRVNYKIADRLFMRKYCFVCYFTIETSKIIERIEQESNFNIAIEDLPSNSEFIVEAEGVSNFFLYDPENDFDMVKEIGRGGTSRIFEVISKTTKEHYALKYLSPHTSKERTLYINEFIIGALSPHTNILKYHRLYIFSGKLYVIQELMDKCLYNVLCPKMPDSIIAYVLKQTLQGLSYLHGKNRVHRDIKSDNILLNPNGEIKLADLGFAVQLTQEKDKRNTLAGSPCWIAPEILNKHPYGTPVDIWSLGVVLIEMLEGNPPNLQKGPKKAMQIIKERGVWLENPDNFNPEFTRFLSYCLNPDPLSRKSANELLEDELIRSAASQLEASTFFMQKKKI